MLATAYASRARSDNTRRAYRRAWDSYKGWCDRLGLAHLSADPQIVAMYLAAAAEGRLPGNGALSGASGK